MEINHEARNERHNKIWISINKWYSKRKKSNFFRKVIVLSFLISIIKISSTYFNYTYSENASAFSVPEMGNNKIVLEEWFVLKRSTQTEKRDKSKQNEIILHKVDSWETLSEIAILYQIKTATLLYANPKISPRKSLKIWTELKILPVDWIIFNAKKDINIDEIAKNYKIDKNKILTQNKLGTWTTIISKNNSIIIPWWKPIIIKKKPIRTKSYAYKTPKNWAWYKYQWAPSAYLIFPTIWKVTQYYRRWHYALDIAHAWKWPIFAAADWVVVRAEYSWWNGWYWKMLIIDHGRWMKTLYAHNSKVYVKVWDTVKQWATVAWMWRTGNVRWKRWIHLHFEVIVNGIKKNPFAYIK